MGGTLLKGFKTNLWKDKQFACIDLRKSEKDRIKNPDGSQVYCFSNFATSCVFKVGIYCGPLTYIYKSLTENIPFMSATWASMDIRSAGLLYRFKVEAWKSIFVEEYKSFWQVIDIWVLSCGLVWKQIKMAAIPHDTCPRLP